MSIWINAQTNNITEDWFKFLFTNYVMLFFFVGSFEKAKSETGIVVSQIDVSYELWLLFWKLFQAYC